MWNLLKDQTKQLGDADLATRKKNLLAILIVLALLMLFFFVYGFYSYDGEGFPLWPLGSVVGFIGILLGNQFDYARREMKRRAKQA